MITKDEITTILRTIIDPELGYNIVELGLVYGIDVKADDITVTMTLTSPGCPLAPYFLEQVKTSVATAANCSENQVSVIITFDPPWSSEAMSDDMKLNLGL